MFSMIDHQELLTVLDFFDVPMFAAERASRDDDFRMIGVNAAHTATTTLKTATIAGKTPHDILDPDDAEAVAGHYAACADRGESIIYSETLRIAGRTRHWRTTLQPVAMTNGCQRVIGIAMEAFNEQEVTGLTDTSYYAAQAQMKIGQLEAFLAYLEQRDDLPLDARAQAMMVAGLTRSLDAVLTNIQNVTERQLHRVPAMPEDGMMALTLENLSSDTSGMQGSDLKAG